MERNKRNEFNIIELLLRPFKSQNKTIRVIIGILELLLIVFSFFSVSNIYEGIVALLLTIVLIVFSRMESKLRIPLSCICALIIFINLVATPLVGAPFFGLLNEERIQQMKREKFYDGFAEALFELSVGDYRSSIYTFEKIKKLVPDEYLLEYYLWYGETAMYAQENALSINLLNKAEQRITEYSNEERDVLFRLIPICKMVNYLNEQDYHSLLKMSKQYQNTNEQIFGLFELASLCLQKDLSAYENRIKEIIARYSEMDASENDLESITLELLAISASKLAEDYPEYALVLLAQLYEENKSFFYENYLFCYPTEYNIFNIRWFSMDYLKAMKEIYHEGWTNLQNNEELQKYSKSIEKLGYYLGSSDILMQIIKENGADWNFNKKYKQWELYNVVPMEHNRYLAIFLDTLEMKDSNKFPVMVGEAHFYIMEIKNRQCTFAPVMINETEFTKKVTMNKLFLVDATESKDKFLITTIEGTGEYLYLEILNLENKTVTPIEKQTETYHSSGFEFDEKNSYTVNFEIGNEIDANMASKVSGKLAAQIDFDKYTISEEISYPDPGVEFYAEERNTALIFPLENLNRLNGREIKNETLLNKIRQNSTPYYKYTLIQQSYESFSHLTNCKFSGLTVVYDSGTNQEATFFFFVQREDENIKLLKIYQVLGSEIVSVY